jgi:hypothetical protein
MGEAPSDEVLALVRLEYVGGLTPPEFQLTNPPFYVLASDGQQIQPGVQIAIYPPPALPALVESRLTAAGIEAVLAAAAEARLTGEDAEYRNQGVTDLPELRLTITAEGHTTTTIAYGLDMLPPDADPELLQARVRIQRFVALVSTPVTELPAEYVAEGERFYDISELEIIAIPEGSVDIEFSGEPVQWPLTTALDQIGIPLGEAVGGESYAAIFLEARTTVLTGADLDAVLPLAEDANQLTPWESGGTRYWVLFRPLLPGEVGGLARPADVTGDATPMA